MPATTPRSCVIRMNAVPNSCAQALQQLEDLRLDRHVERGRRLVGDEQLRVAARAPSRSSRAGAYRRRTGAGSRRRAASRSGCRPARAARWCACAPRSGSSSGAARAPREIWRLMVSTGLSDVIGSWKIIAMSLPRIPRTSSSFIFRMSWPSNMTWPSTILPGGCGMRRMSDSAVTLLPQPDSPTMPSVSPAATWNETPSTAWTTPSCVKNWVWRSVTSRRSANVGGV